VRHAAAAIRPNPSRLTRSSAGCCDATGRLEQCSDFPDGNLLGVHNLRMKWWYPQPSDWIEKRRRLRIRRDLSLPFAPVDEAPAL